MTFSHLDLRGQDTVINPGVTFLRDAHDPLDTTTAARNAIADPSGFRYAALTAMMDPSSGLLEGVMLFRASAEGAFTEQQRSAVQMLVPHLCQARSANLVARASDIADAGFQASYHTLVCNVEGYLMAIEPEAMALMRSEWPAWPGGRLPQALQDAAQAVRQGDGQTQWRGKAVVARAYFSGTRMPTQMLWRLRPPNRIDTLAPRERLVAEQYASGASCKEIARDLNTSPSTVSNQLSKVYAKLGISNKAELARCLTEWR